ncbi:TonB-dependent receptor [Sphingomonas sp. RP10(2022)]|uniref:TonB-dependent receptor n=1 Tax=Sphingomonas liriopis TaxID=2949094 RepID=A0A9X2KP42_9SPHN|nr:TonB-dependent receptor [Sphingomonas liriopis]MCP3734304.1 TonB-dependent receptor [Sphingomonas liriopis]
MSYSRSNVSMRALWLAGAMAVASGGAGAGVAQAQTAPAPQAPAGADQPQDGDIVVTGTSAARRARDTPLSVSTIDATQLQRTAASSQADILNTVPSIKAEGGGGEVAVNVFIKGLPLGGTYQLTPLQYDGIPVLSSFGLNSSAYDVYYRNDPGIERLEFVRGGVSNLFGSGSVAGLINYISKTGTDTPQGTVQAEWAERGRFRGDVAASGPLDAAGLYYAFSGYFRHDDGPIRTGLPTKGGQLRGNIRKDFSDGSGSVTLSGQYIHDRVQFYLPFPLDGATRERIPGNDGKLVNSLLTDAVSGLGFATPGGGRFQTRIADGVYTAGGQVALAFTKDFGDGWGLNGKAKYSRYAHRFGFFLDGDGLANVPQTQAGFLALRGLPSNASFTYADDGSAVPGSAILFANRFQDRNRPNHDTTAELNLTRQLTDGDVRHNLTLGGYFADAWARDQTVTTAYLGAFNNRPRLINLTVRNAAGVPTIVSNGGLLDAGVGYTDNTAKQTHYAVYLADQIEGGRLVFDFGGRVEWSDGDIARAATATTITDATTPNLSTALRNVVWETGTVVRGKVSASSWALSAGVLYKLTPSLNLYANANRGFFFPALNSVAVNAAGQTQSYQPEIIRQAEAGLKFGAGRVTASLSGFYNDLKNRRTVLLVNAPGGGVTEQVTIVSTKAYGLEAVLGVRLLDHLRFDGNVSLVHDEFTALDITPQFVGNKEPRQPNVLYNAGLYYDDDAFDASVATTYTGPNYTDNSNAIRLNGFNTVRLIAGYKLPLADRQSVRLGVDVYNLFDSQGISEGSPRQVSQTVGTYFVGRPILPRRLSIRLSYDF